jgi:autoinducer 2 (AI-2) kinase
VIHAPGRNADAVADLTIALMLMLMRNIMPAAALLRSPNRDVGSTARIYFDLRGRELWNKTVGIVGLGAVGRMVARRLIPFGVRLIAYDPFVPQEVMDDYQAAQVDLDTLMRESDIVTLHVYVTPRTRGLVGAREIGLMKKTAYFVNTARSAITDEKALCRALSDRRIAGAGLDVFDQEPLPPEHLFFSLDNVILLPHIGGATQEVTEHQTEIIVPDIERILRGERPRNIVNPEVLDRFTFRK